MHKKVAKLTGITTEDLQYGFPFPAAMKHFRKWCGDAFVFLTWGYDDIRILRDNMLLYKLNTDWLPDAYNIQIIFNDQVSKENRQFSLTSAMQKIGAPALEAHDALHDAKNTACICLSLDMEKGLREYSELQKQMNGCENMAVRSEFGKTYPTRSAAFSDPDVTRFYCPKCSEMVTCVDVLRQNSEKFIAVGKCENGDEFFVRFKFTRTADGTFRVVRIVREMDEENRRYHMDKKQRREDAESAYLQRIEIAG